MHQYGSPPYLGVLAHFALVLVQLRLLLRARRLERADVAVQPQLRLLHLRQTAAVLQPRSVALQVENSNANFETRKSPLDRFNDA